MLEDVGVKLEQYAREEDDPRLRGISNVTLANACFLRDDFKTGYTLIRKAISDLEGTEDQEALITALFHQTILKWWLLDFEFILSPANRLTQIINNLDPALSVKLSEKFSVNRMIAEAYYGLGEAEKALEIAQKTYRKFFKKLDTFDRLRALQMLAHIHFISGQIDQCAHYAQEGLKITRSLENVFIEELLLIILSKAEIVQGHLDQAYQHATKVLMLGERHQKIQTTVAANTLLGDIYAVLQIDTMALRRYRIAQVRQGFSTFSYYGLENNIHLSRFLIKSGQVAEANEIIQTTLGVTLRKGMLLLNAQALMVAGLIDIVTQNFTAAEEKFVSVIEKAEQKGFPQEALWAKYRLACLELSRQNFDRAGQYLNEVFESPESSQMALLSLSALKLIGKLPDSAKKRVYTSDLQVRFQTLVAKLEAHTQSEPLRQDFLNAQRLWREKEIFS